MDGVSPAWPIDYAALAPYYERAERLYQVRGATGDDPTEPPRGPYPHPPVPHAAEIADAVERLREQGLHPSPLPLGLIAPGEPGGCILCNTCNSFPCRRHAKSEAEVCCVRPAAGEENVTLWTHAFARRLLTDAAGRRVTAVEVERGGETLRVEAPLVVAACGAVNSAALLLRSAGGRHPDGLGNSSGLVGRRYMAHLATMMQGVHPFRRNHAVFQKTVGINDYYLRGSEDAPSARPDPVAGPHARRDGADGRAVGAGSGVRRLDGARSRLARAVRGPAAAGQPRHRRRGRTHPAGVPSQQPARAPAAGAGDAADPAPARGSGWS